jgi:rare lipoprotein A
MKKLFLLSLLVFTCTMYSQETTLKGKVSYYANKFHGRKTASGRLFDNTKLTCAHKTLPFGTLLKIINPTFVQQDPVTITTIGYGFKYKNKTNCTSR